MVWQDVNEQVAVAVVSNGDWCHFWVHNKDGLPCSFRVNTGQSPTKLQLGAGLQGSVKMVSATVDVKLYDEEVHIATVVVKNGVIGKITKHRAAVTA